MLLILVVLVIVGIHLATGTGTASAVRIGVAPFVAIRSRRSETRAKRQAFLDSEGRRLEFRSFLSLQKVGKGKGKIAFVIGRHLYIFHATGSNFYKIGAANKPFRRLEEIQTGCPFKLECIWLSDDHRLGNAERSVHHIFKDHCVHHEWFELSESDLARLIALLDSGIENVNNTYRAMLRPKAKKKQSGEWANPLGSL